MTVGSPELCRDDASPAHAPVLVLGLGNLLLRDDAVGLHLLKLLRGERDVSGVEFVDGGTQGVALLGWLDERSAVLLLDAVGLGAAPGTIHVLDGNEALRLRARRTTTAHEGNALELLHLARLLGTLPPRVVVLGIEPGEVRTGLGLTGEVEAALPQALERARGALQEFIETAV